MAKKLLIGITGASGAIYGIRLLQILRDLNVETHLVISKAAEMTIAYESDYSAKDVKKIANHCYAIGDIGASPASGSYKFDGMIIAPCSMKSLAEIATGIGGNLISRSADVILKERRRLVLMTRETPLNNIHLKNMLTASRAGAIIAPPMPAFYTRPDNIEQIIDHNISRILDLFTIDTGIVKQWSGKPKKAN